jgi:hypothetical protein
MPIKESHDISLVSLSKHDDPILMHCAAADSDVVVVVTFVALSRQKCWSGSGAAAVARMNVLQVISCC